MMTRTSHFLSSTTKRNDWLLCGPILNIPEQRFHMTQCFLGCATFDHRPAILNSNRTAGFRQASNYSFDENDPLHRKSSSQSKQQIPFYGLPQKPDHNKRTVISSLLPSVGTLRNMMKLSSTQSDTVTKFVQQSMIAIRDPTRADAVAAVGEMTGRQQLSYLLKTMQQHPVGQQILHDRPIVSKTTIPYDHFVEQARQIKEKYVTVANIPKEELTFGIAYGLFLLKHGFDPDERDDVKFLSSNKDEETDISYVMLRYRQCHDYWHVLTQLPPTVNGEIGLKLLELFHMNMPVAALSCLAQSAVLLSNAAPTSTGTRHSNLTTATDDLHTIWNLYLPWARQQARNMQIGNVSLLNVRYEHEFSVPLHTLRHRLQLQPFMLPNCEKLNTEKLSYR